MRVRHVLPCAALLQKMGVIAVGEDTLRALCHVDAETSASIAGFGGGFGGARGRAWGAGVVAPWIGGA